MITNSLYIPKRKEGSPLIKPEGLISHGNSASHTNSKAKCKLVARPYRWAGVPPKAYWGGHTMGQQPSKAADLWVMTLPQS